VKSAAAPFVLLNNICPFVHVSWHSPAVTCSTKGISFVAQGTQSLGQNFSSSSSISLVQQTSKMIDLTISMPQRACYICRDSDFAVVPHDLPSGEHKLLWNVAQMAVPQLHCQIRVRVLPAHTRSGANPECLLPVLIYSDFLTKNVVMN
jgi:hypothetical protein